MARMTRLPGAAMIAVLVVALPTTGAGSLLAVDGHPLTIHAMVSRLASESLPPLSPFQAQSLALSSDIVEIANQPESEDFHRAIELGERVTRGQADILGLDWESPTPLKGFLKLSSALEELARRSGVVLTEDQAQSVLALDVVPEPLRSALARFVDAFLALDTAAKVDADWVALAAVEKRLADLGGVTGSISDDPALQRPSSLQVDLSPVFPARVQFLEAIQELHDVIVAAAPHSSLGCDFIGVPKAFSLDLAGCDSTYTDFYLLQLDVGGNDKYYNNAGGSNIWGGYFCGLPLPGGRAALVDFGQGLDLYGYPPLPLRCGVNGGASMAGMGFLLDDGGDDTYLAEYIGTNGGADIGGTGFLLDVGGHDSYYTWSGGGVNGGGFEAVGTVIDTNGDDVYCCGGSGSSGGGQGFLYTTGLGMLVDTEGNDLYSSRLAGNGGGADSGFGFLLDVLGDDTYYGNGFGTNGGGYYGEGFLLDATGNDRYIAGSIGTNGGGSTLGRGFLVDLGGDDEYRAEAYGNNGGAFPYPTGIIPRPARVQTGFLFDANGHDYYFDSITDCWDCTVIPKGLVGIQFDASNPIP